LKPRKVGLTDQELEIMKVVWERGSATVREVYEELLKQRKIAYTTVMTMMGILEQKGRLNKEVSERAYVYTRPSSARSSPADVTTI
jgi:predicted transcriptional regulator